MIGDAREVNLIKIKPNIDTFWNTSYLVYLAGQAKKGKEVLTHFTKRSAFSSAFAFDLVFDLFCVFFPGL